MGNYLFYNGELYKDDKPLFGANNRGLRYGDGLFETMKMTSSGIALQDYHFQRLYNGLKLLQFELPGYFTPAWLEKNIGTLYQKNNETTARVRLTVFRGNGGLYDPENHFPNCVIQTWPLPTANKQLNENGLVLGVYDLARKTQDIFSNLKHNNYLTYLMAALHAKQQRWNDALVLNAAGRVCDTTIANIFLVNKGVIFTPLLSEGCVAGVMRRWLMEQLPTKGYTIEEKQITTGELEAADEIFLTNSIYGIRWVQSCNGYRFTNSATRVIYDSLLKNFPG